MLYKPSSRSESLNNDGVLISRFHVLISSNLVIASPHSLSYQQIGTEYTPLAVLSRPVAGLRGKTLIVTLPGSPKAVKENLETLAPLLPKIFQLMQVGTCDHKPT